MEPKMSEQARLERAERARKGRMSAGFFWLGAGLMTLAIGLVSGPDSWIGQLGADGWMIGVGAAATVIGIVMAWANRPTEAARKLETTAGARDRAQRDRAQMLAVIPPSMLIFGGLSVKGMSAAQAGTAEFSDWGMIGIGLMYAWMGPLFVMGWDGKSLRNRALLEDELTRHHRAKSVIPAFIFLMVLMTGLCLLGIWRPDLAVRLTPLAMCVAGAGAVLRFSHLEKQAETDDGA